MIEIPRALVRQFRAVLRKSVVAADPRGPCPLVLIQSGRAGLYLSCSQGDVAVRHHSPGLRMPHRLALPLTAFAELEGRSNGTVVLEKTGPFQVRASWQEGETARSRDFDTADADSCPSPLEPAANSVQVPNRVPRALAEAARTTCREVGRFSLSRILLRGSDGSIVATDGRQLLIQTGFGFPWKDALLIPSLPVFDSKELPAEEPIRVGLAGEHVTLEVGSWLFRLKAEPATRYPDVNQAIPSTRGITARLQIDPQDGEALVTALSRLPKSRGSLGQVTLDLADRVVVRSSEETEPALEVVLGRSTLRGKPIRLATHPRYLMRAVQLGFTEVLLSSPDRPLLCRDKARTYLWMPLTAPDPAAPVVQPVSTIVLSNPKAELEPNRRSPVMPLNNGKPTEDHREPTHVQEEFADPIVEAEALRSQLQEAVSRTTRLLTALKHERRRNRAVEAAVASLRRLRNLER